MQRLMPESVRLDVIAALDGDKVVAELDVRNNASVRIGDQYVARWEDGTVSVLRVKGFKSAETYSNTIARRIDAMRERVADVPNTLPARKAYQVKLAVLAIEGELLPDGRRRIGASRIPDVMLPLERITDDLLEQFATSPGGNVVLGNLQSGSRTLGRLARLDQNYTGERMVVFGRPGQGKSQLIRSLLSQAMAEE